jgi:allophanate hydrolase
LWKTAKGLDPADPYSRSFNSGVTTLRSSSGSFRFGIPDDSQLKFFGDDEAPLLYRKAIDKVRSIGGQPVTVDFTPFREAAELLYSGPWVAERYASVGEFLQTQSEGVNEVVKAIILGGAKFSAADAFRSMYRLETLKQSAAKEWARMDVLVLPTTGTIYRREAVMSDPIRLNSNLGFYTNFVNLMDLVAVAVPAGFRHDGLPLGVSLIGTAFSDEALLDLASRFCQGN